MSRFFRIELNQMKPLNYLRIRVHPCLSMVIFFLSLTLNAQDTYPKIYDSTTWNLIGHEEIAEKFKSVDVILIGEEHDDKVGHAEKLKLIRFLSERQSFIISMEMLNETSKLF